MRDSINIFNGKFELADLGRHKETKTVELNSEDDFWKAITPHLMSRDIEYEYNTESKVGKIFAGFRQVGTFRPIEKAK